jgi:hypothetical protein
MSDNTMVKIVCNVCYGGFGLSDAGIRRYAELAGLTEREVVDNIDSIKRHDLFLVQTVEELGDEVNDIYSALCIIEVPKGSLYRIDDYDGNESVMLQSDYKWTIAE